MQTGRSPFVCHFLASSCRGIVLGACCASPATVYIFFFGLLPLQALTSSWCFAGAPPPHFAEKKNKKEIKKRRSDPSLRHLLSPQLASSFCPCGMDQLLAARSRHQQERRDSHESSPIVGNQLLPMPPCYLSSSFRKHCLVCLSWLASKLSRGSFHWPVSPQCTLSTTTVPPRPTSPAEKKN